MKLRFPFRHLVKFCLAGVLLLLVTASGVAWWVGRAGDSALEQWAKEWLITELEARLGISISIESVDYQYPYTLVLTQAEMAVDDPRSPGTAFRLLAIKRAELTLESLPETGQPLRIASLRSDDAVIQVAEDVENGGYIGMSHFVVADEEYPDDYSLPVLSSLVELQRIELINTQIIYETGGAEAGQLILDGVTLESDLTPDPDIPGLYALGLELNRGANLKVSCNAKIDVDRWLIDDLDLDVDLDLDGDANASLPPSLQKVLRQFRIRGTYELDADGKIDIFDPENASLTIGATVDDASLTYAGYTHPLKNLSISARAHDRRLQIIRADAAAYGGTVSLKGNVALDGHYYRAALTSKAKRVELAKPTSDAVGAKWMAYQGKMDFNIFWDGSLAYATVDAGGRGDIKLYEGRFVDVAFLTELGDLLDNMKGNNRRGRDLINVFFNFKRTHVHFTRITAKSGALTVIGQARLFFDQRVKALFDAGILNSITRRYVVEGTLWDYNMRKAGVKDVF